VETDSLAKGRIGWRTDNWAACSLPDDGIARGLSQRRKGAKKPRTKRNKKQGFNSPSDLPSSLPLCALASLREIPFVPKIVDFGLAMAQHHLGHAKEAADLLAKATAHGARAKDVSWNQQVELFILRREAEALVKGKGATPRK
jgi:hypothetical protein